MVPTLEFVVRKFPWTEFDEFYRKAPDGPHGIGQETMVDGMVIYSRFVA